MKNPLVSVIIPIYNVEKWLPECVDSVLNQTYKNLEVILVDDGSPDGCPAICDEYATRDPRIKVIHKPNGGLSDARNAGIKAMMGEYVIFMDSDDFWLNTFFLEKIVIDIVNKHEPDCILLRAISVSETGIYGSPDPILSGYNIDKLPRRQVIEAMNSIGTLWASACTKLVKSDIICGNSIFFEKGILSEDIDYTLQLYPLIAKFFYYDEPVYAYRKREGSITHTIGVKAFDSILYIIDKWTKLIGSLSVSESEKEIFMSFLAYQYSILLAFLPDLDKDQRAKYKIMLKERSNLLSYTANPKVRKIARLYNIAGINITSRILNLYLSIR